MRRMLLEVVSVVQTPRLRAFETNERRIEKFVGTMDPYFVGRNAAVLQYTRFVYTDQATRRRISNAATPKPGGFDKEWARLDLAPMKMRGKTELPEASLILTSVKPELTVGGTLQTRTFLASFGCEEIKVVYGEEEDESAGILIISKFPKWAESEKQGPSSSKKDTSEGDDGQGGSRRTEEPMQQGNDQADSEDDKASTGGKSSLDFNFLGTLRIMRIRWKRLSQQTKALRHETSVGLYGNETEFAGEQLSGQFKRKRTKTPHGITEEKKNRSPCQRPILGTLPEEEWQVHHRDHENRTGCKLDRVAFMEEVWTVVQSYGTQSILKVGLNRPLMREVLDKLDECKGRLSELLIEYMEMWIHGDIGIPKLG